jgi:hypothetical protein
MEKHTVAPGRRSIAKQSDVLRRLIRLRSAVAWTVTAALLLPALFSLTASNPEWVLGIEPSERESGAHAAAHHGTADHEKSHSDIPGAPDHPADHNCAPCQVLKYLACYLPESPLALPSSTHYSAPPGDRAVQQRPGDVASLPPSRAPPRALI